MKKITTLVVAAILCLYVNGQQPAVQPLYINDQLPDITLTHIINYKTATAKLSELQSGHTKMVLFDFWITSCIPCIKQFPKLDSLQRLFKNGLQIILVTTEPTNHVQAFLKRWEAKYDMKFSFPIVTADTLLQNYFRQESKPNYAWLAADNVYMAQTAATFITAPTIEAIIKKAKEEIALRGYLNKNN